MRAVTGSAGAVVLGAILVSTAVEHSRVLSPPASATRTITVIAGRTVLLPAVVNRVADPWPANNGMVLMLGGADKLVATTAQARKQPWFRHMYPRIDQVPAVGVKSTP